MYICEKHGELKTDWCDDCGQTVKCDCSTIISFNGYIEHPFQNRQIEIVLECCKNCGDIVGVSSYQI